MISILPYWPLNKLISFKTALLVATFLLFCKELSIKFYASQTDVQLDVDEWSFILSTATDFLPRALKNEDDYLNFSNQ